MIKRFRIWILIPVCTAFFCGCFNMTPDYRQPDLGIEAPVAYQHEPKEEPALQMADRWWEVFGDAELNKLVDEVLQNNWDLKRTAGKILESRALYVRRRADRFPQVGVDGQAARRQFGGTSVGSGTISNAYQISAPAFFEVDLWGRLASAERSAWEDLLRDEESRRTVAQTVVAETVNLYLLIEAVERRVQISLDSIAAFRQSLNFVETRYKRGLTSILDVRQARRVLAGAEALLPAFRQQLGIAQQQLSLLLGRYPETRPARKQPEDYYQRLGPVPAGLPSDLLQQRPDVRAAEARLKSFNEQIGVAKAARFPSISLTGSYGYSSGELNELLRPDNIFWNISAGITQPIFDAGKLKAGQRAAEARYQQVMAEYVTIVLNAFGEVEGALLTRQQQLERRERLLNFVQEARATQRVAQNRYIRGLTTYLDVLNAQQTRFQAEDNLVEVDLTIFTNRVNLHRAFGGGWAEPAPVPEVDIGYFVF